MVVRSLTWLIIEQLCTSLLNYTITKTYHCPKITNSTKNQQDDARIHNKYTITITILCFGECKLTALYMQPSIWRIPFQKTAPQASKVQQWRFPSDHCGLVKVRLRVLALWRVAAGVGHLGIPHLALALPQLGDVALEAQAELGVLSLGRLERSLL